MGSKRPIGAECTADRSSGICRRLVALSSAQQIPPAGIAFSGPIAQMIQRRTDVRRLLPHMDVYAVAAIVFAALLAPARRWAVSDGFLRESRRDCWARNGAC